MLCTKSVYLGSFLLGTGVLRNKVDADTGLVHCGRAPGQGGS